jgi:hypothetical protein
MKEFFKEVYEEMGNESSKMFYDTLNAQNQALI